MADTDDKSLPESQPEAGTEDKTSGDADLNTLLNEYEEGTKKSDTKPEPKQESKSDPVYEFARQQMAENQKKTFDRDVKAAVETVGNSEAFKDKGLPNKVLRGLLLAYAQENPDFDQAFQQRAEKPKAWESALKSAAKSLGEEFGDLPKMSLREDVEAAKATVTGTRKKSDTDEEEGVDVAKLMNMSDAEYRNYCESEFQKAS